MDRSLRRLTALFGALAALIAPASASAGLPVSYSLPGAGAYAVTHVDEAPPGLSVGLTLGSLWSLITGRSDIQISDVQSEQLTGPQSTHSGKVEKHLVLALRRVHDPTDFLLREPALLNVGDRG